MSFSDCSFDTVCISNSLHHVPDIQGTLGEMKRVLRPGGYFLVNELICDELDEKQQTHMLFHHLRAEVETLRGISHRFTYTKKQVLEMFQSTGLTVLDMIGHRNEQFDRYVNPQIFAETFQKEVEKVREFERYADLTKRLDELIDRLNKVGIAFATQVLIIGRKAE